MSKIITAIACITFVFVFGTGGDEGEVRDITRETIGVLDEIRLLKQKLETIQSSRLPPIGSIVAWHRDVNDPAVPNESHGGKRPLQLPDGWLVCNGPLDKDDPTTIIDETRIPDLNGACKDGVPQRRFLRGTNSVTGLLQDDTFQGHWHQGAWDMEVGATVGGKGFSSTGNTAHGGNKPIRNPTTGDHDEPRIGTETRPVNMSIVWIIRVK
ncbi:MAG TPA: hypothetical protein PK093_12635 [Phycisphaerae bacterium]|nr:hypothetical protein [Phycisphaerae bacterium]